MRPVITLSAAKALWPLANQRAGIERSSTGPIAIFSSFAEARLDRCRVGAQFFGADAGSEIGTITIKAGKIVIAASTDQGRNLTFVTTLIRFCLLRPPIAAVLSEPGLIGIVGHWRRMS